MIYLSRGPVVFVWQGRSLV